MPKSSLLTFPFSFLTQLSANNNREWFNSNKDQYLKAHQQVIEFADLLLGELNKTDIIETPTGKKSLYRIYRDVRFSKDKTPYSTYFGGGFRRATAERRGGYYFHLEPGNTYVGGGFWGPNSQDMMHIRKHLQQEPERLRDIITNKNFKKQFGVLLGEQLKRAPKGFEIDDPAIDLLRYKQYWVRHEFSTAEVLSPDFHLAIVKQFQHIRPFFDYMSEVLTTDLNGESIL
ncbi:DUF2461 domain-containing protein [Reichenbachiella carrageenanivorans]|uniref:DUF2461 domain-containing protein n=1 Tax=Reichenbachiella carrageenanivorans TaxID=2979869 RepID=A0ABY6D690_9BACT|nr:DUF2461 domain-containing protein [Reichenbachiella carrageenanivorans]UXX80658.1 DUF2461 domain-containing protein [Reichenbachiella carrageenanivorans]